jgi:hypothetical protein
LFNRPSGLDEEQFLKNFVEAQVRNISHLSLVAFKIAVGGGPQTNFYLAR